MMRLFTLLLVGLSLSAAAQNTGGCGTVTPQSEVDKIYDFVQHNAAAYAKPAAGAIDSIPLSIHIVGTDAGTGYYPLQNLFTVLCQLNQRYAPSGFHFYVQWPLRYINNTAYYIHDFSDGYYMMQQNNVPGAVNVYFVNDPAGNCGYYTYGADALAIGNKCAGSGSTTLTHELGHYFSLPHTFYGWEGGNTPSNPEAVRRTGPGTNCSSAGDGFCDTYADYISNRWSCPALVSKTDVYGDLYHIDSSMYMSYSFDACQSQFSAQQMAAMQYNLHVVRNSFAGTSIPPVRSLSAPNILYPADTLYVNGKKAAWRSVPGADYYYAFLSLQTDPTRPIVSALTKDTSLNFSTYGFVDEGQYAVTVVPVNAHDFCMNYKTVQPFVYTARAGALGVTTLREDGGILQAYPNPLPAGMDMQLRFGGLPVGSYTLSLTSLNGQVVAEQTVEYRGSGIQTFRMRNCPEGFYFLRWKGAGGQGVLKLRVGQ